MIKRMAVGVVIASCIHITHACADDLRPDPAASYLTPSGKVAIIGNDGMGTLVGQLNELFTRQHPQISFEVTAKGSSVGIPALTAGATAIAPLSREPWLGDAHGFKQVHGRAPVDIRIGYSGHGPRANGKTPPAVYINPNNPLSQLSMEQLAKVVTAGQPGGDINTWGQLGLTGDWADRRIHVYGLRDDGGFATNQRMDRFGGKAFSAKYEALPDRAAVLKAVSSDSHAIGLTGWVSGGRIAPELRIVPISEKPGGKAYSPALADVQEGKYPLSSYLHLFVNVEPGKPVEPFIKEYLRIALSDEGQALVREHTSTAEGYVPLSAHDLAVERKKLSQLK